MAETLKIKIILPAPKTRDLIPPELQAECQITMDADKDHERVKWEYYKSNYEKLFTQKLKEQIKHMAAPLESMQKEIDALRSDYEKATSSKDYQELQKQMEKAKDKHEKLKTTIKEYKPYLEKMVNNIAQQQSLIWHSTFEAEAQAMAARKIKSDIRWKKARHIAGIVMLGTLALAAGAAAVVGAVASFGTLPAVIGAIGIAVAGIGALKTIYDVGKKVNNTVKMEEKSLEKLRKDLEEVATHMGKTGDKTKGLAKHLDDASRFHSERRTFISEADKKVQELDKQIKQHESQVAKLARLDKTPDLIKKNEKKIKELTKNKKQAVKAIQECMKRDEELNKVFEEARKLIGDLQKINFLGPRSLSDSLQRYKNFDSALGVVSQLGGIATGAGSLAGA